MQRLEVSGAVRPLYRSLGVKGLMEPMESGSLYRARILSDNVHHYSLTPFSETADSAALAAIPICSESGSTRPSPMYRNQYRVLIRHF